MRVLCVMLLFLLALAPAARAAAGGRPPMDEQAPSEFRTAIFALG